MFTQSDLELVVKFEFAHSDAVGMCTPSVEYAFSTSSAGSVFAMSGDWTSVYSGA